MKVVHGAPPSYSDEMAKLNLTNARARRFLNNGFPVAVESHWDDARDARVFTVCTPYGERSRMTLTGADLPRRISNMCPVVQDETLMHRDPSTPSELLGQFFVDPTRVAAYVESRNIHPYDYASKAVNNIASLPGGYVGTHQEVERPSKFDCMQRTATAVFSYDIATPRIGPGGADSVILTGDLAQVWEWSRLAEKPLQESLEEVFCDAIGAKAGTSIEQRLGSPMKRIRDVPLFYMTDVKRQGSDFTRMTRMAVLTMKSIPCMLNDAYLKQINTAFGGVYPLNETPTVPLSIFHEVCEEYRDGCVDEQVVTLEKLVDGNYRYFNNVMKIAREGKQRLAGTIIYHRHLACSRCGQDTTSQFSIHQEVIDINLSHCQSAIQNAGKFVTIQTKGNRRTHSLDCCRQVRRICQGLPQYDKGDDRIGIFTEEETKRIFERPCVISDCLQAQMLPDIGNQRGKYDNVSTTVYVLVPFDLGATLERLKQDGVEDPQVSLLTLHNVVDCVVPIYSNSQGLTEYRFKALAFRGKITISVQAYGKTPAGDIALFDPESTTKRLSLEMLEEDGKVKLHQYWHQLEYNRKRYFQTQGTMLSVTNFKQYKARDTKDTIPIEQRTNWDEYGYTLVGAMAANWVRCAHYAGQPLVSPGRLRFGIVSDTREQEDSSQKRLRKREDRKRKRDTESWAIREGEMREEIDRLGRALEEERQRTRQLSSELNMTQLMLEFKQICGQQDQKKIDELIKTNEMAVREYSILKAAKEERMQELEARVATLTAQLDGARQQRKTKRRKSRSANKRAKQDGPPVSWVPGCGVSVIAV